MTAEKDRALAPASLDSLTIDFVIRVALLALLGYWALKVIAPFITVALWSAILTVALYPLFDWLARKLGSRRLAATLITLLCLMIVIGPMTWLGYGLIGGVDLVVKEFDADKFSMIPLPPESVKGWPLIGEQMYRLWSVAATDTKAALLQVAPKLTPLAGRLLGIGESVIFGLLEFVASIVIAGFLFSPGPRLVDVLGALLRRILSDRGKEMVHLVGGTIRNVSRGVVGIALLQSLLAGLGFLVVGIHAAGLLSFIALVLGIVQIGPAILLIPIVLWSWTALETTNAVLFTAYMVPVGLLDNVLRPILMARGLTTPMPVILIGVIGGTIADGISGLFLGPIILSVAWVLIVAWVQEDNAVANNALLGGAESCSATESHST
jgi:predicted PurR-regulated permease PerM